MNFDDFVLSAGNFIVHTLNLFASDLRRAAWEARIVVNQACDVDPIAFAEICDVGNQIFVGRERLIAFSAGNFRFSARINFNIGRKFDIFGSVRRNLRL